MFSLQKPWTIDLSSNRLQKQSLSRLLSLHQLILSIYLSQSVQEVQLVLRRSWGFIRYFLLIKSWLESFLWTTIVFPSANHWCFSVLIGCGFVFSVKVTSKHLKGGKETKMDVLVMENLLYRRNIRRLYDLKGSSRSRYNPDTSGSNKVLLDQNLIEAMPTSPIFVGNKAKRLLERAVWNDTAFLAVSLMPFTSSILYILVFRCTFMDFLATFFSFFASIMMLGGRTYD